MATLGVSNYTYAEVTETQGLEDWINSHVRAFAFFGAVPELLVPDNLKSAITKSDRYDPQVNATYADMASHYGVGIYPSRPRRPRDKAKVENGVQQVERSILARLRNIKFFDLQDANNAVAGLLEELNGRTSDYLGGSRLDLYLQLDKPAMKPLPAEPYEFANWRTGTIDSAYHVRVDGCRYSVPYTLIGKQVGVKVSSRVVEVFHDHERVASHRRLHGKGKRSTLDATCPHRTGIRKKPPRKNLCERRKGSGSKPQRSSRAF